MSSSDLPGCRSQRRKHRRPLLQLAAIWILITLACQLPGQVISTPPFAPSRTPTPGSVAVARSTPPAQVAPEAVLPPTLVEVRPLQGSQLQQDEGFTLVFSLPMNHAAVEAAVQTSPTLPGSFRWQGDTEVTFLPESPLPVDSELKLTVSTAAQSQDGQPLARIVDLYYRTPPALMLASFQPAPDAQDIDPRGAVLVTFNQPVGGKSAPAALTLSPEVKGHGEWQSPSVYAFYPQPGLKGGSAYTVRLDPSLAARLPAGAEPAWQFTTRSPHLVSVDPSHTGSLLFPNAVFGFTFNEAVDRASLENHFTLIGADGFPVHGSFHWKDDSTQVTFDPDVLLLRGTAYYLTLTNEVVSAAGESFPELPLKASYLTAALPKLTAAQPVSGGILELKEGRGQVALQFNVPLAAQPLFDQVKLEPSVQDLSVALESRSSMEDTLTLSGSFQPNTRYNVTLSPDLTDRWNKRLGETIAYTFQTAPSQPGLSWVSGQPGTALHLRPDAAALSVKVVGLSALDISTASLSLDEYLGLATNPDNLRKLPESRWETTWTQPLTLVNEAAVVSVPFIADGSSLPSGLYAVRIASPGQQSAPFLVVSSGRYVSIQRSAGLVQVWAVDLEDASPVAGATVDLYDGQGKRVASLKTGSDGLGRLDLPEQSSAGMLYAVLGQPGGAGFGLAVSAAPDPNAGAKTIQSAPPSSASGRSFLETDRKTIRPGETLRFRLFAGAGMAGQTVHLRIWQEGGSTSLDEIPFVLSAFGTAGGVYTLPPDLSTGVLFLSLVGQPEVSTSLRIAAPVPTQARLSLSPDRQVVFPGQGLKASAAAVMNAGSVATGLDLNWRLLAFPEPDILPPGYQSGLAGWDWLEAGNQITPSSVWTELAQGSEETGLDGLAQIQVPADQLAALPAGVLTGVWRSWRICWGRMALPWLRPDHTWPTKLPPARLALCQRQVARRPVRSWVSPSLLPIWEEAPNPRRRSRQPSRRSPGRTARLPIRRRTPKPARC